MTHSDDSKAQPVTQLLAQWHGGDQRALARLTAILYDDLRRLAQGYLRRERADHTMQRTALVHEAFARLIDQHAIDWHSRSHFFALASRLMRGILVDHARARLADKRGGGVRPVSIDQFAASWRDEDSTPLELTTPTALQHLDSHTQEDVSAIDQALAQLERIDPRQAQIVEMRYFGGLTIEQTAEAMGISDATVKREWTHARAWLRCELGKNC